MKIRAKFPDRVPAIVERAPNAGKDLPECSKRKFLVPEDITMGAFSFEIRKHMPELDSTKAIYLFINNTLPSQSTLMSDIYSRYKEEDGFVYVTFSGENAFGSSS